MNIVEQDGYASLLVVDGAYTIEEDGQQVTLKRADGSVYFESTLFEFIHAEPQDGGYVGVLQFSDGRISLRWFDETGTLLDYTAPDSLESYVDREAEIGIDLNGDGVLSTGEVFVEQDGAASLSLVDGAYTVDDGTQQVTLKRADGSVYFESTLFEFIHAEPQDGGYVGVLQFSDGRISLRWFDETGTLLDYTAPDSLESYVDREAEIGIDLNGDGVLSSPAPTGEVIDTMGDATLLLTESGYELEVAGVSNPVLGADGQQLTSDGNFTLARFAQDGGTSEYVLVGEYADSGEFDIYIVDPQGALIQRFGPMSEAVTQAFELDHQIDLTGDGVIGRGDAASQGTTTELFTDWSTGGAIRGDTADNDVVVNDYLNGPNPEESWVDVFGGAGNDILVGGDGENFFIGGAGDDVLYAGDRAINGDNSGDQEAIYDSRGNGATQSPDYRLESDGTVTIFDDTGELYSIRLNGEIGTVTDLSTADGLDEGTDSLVAIDAVFVITDQGEIGVGFNPDTGEYVVKSQNEEFIEIERDDEWGYLEGEISGTNAADVIDVSTREEFSEFGPDHWIDIEGNGGNDTLTGHDGGNWISGGKGDDQIDGGAGWDVAGYELFDLNDYSPFLDYEDNGDGSVTITKNGVAVFDVVLNLDGTGTVTDLREGPENLGTDTLTNIESIEFEGSVDWLAIERTDAGYKVSGTKYLDYYFDEAQSFGHIGGTAFDDVMEVTAENGFDPLVFDESSYVGMWGGAGNDTMIGHIGGNSFEGGRGDDIIDGGSEPSSAWDTAGYRTEDYSAFDPFFDSAEGVYHYDLREEADGSVTVFVNEQDLYNINLGGEESWVQDLWLEDGDTGRDTLFNIETVGIETPVGYLSINYGADTGYEISGDLVRNYVWAESYDDGLGSGVIHGTAKDDVINAADFSEVDATSMDAYIELKGGDGNDTLTGHLGGNELEGGAGNDTLNGEDGWDRASYNVENWAGWDQFQYDEFGNYIDGWLEEFNVRDNGDGSLTVFANTQDLYRVTLDEFGNGTVEDLWSADGDTGIDTLNSVEDVSISIPDGYMTISFDAYSGYEVYGIVSDAPYAEGYGDGSGIIYGSTGDDVLDAADFSEVNASDELATIDFAASEGNDVMTGHAGANDFYTGYNDGNDTMNGGAGYDQVSYYNLDESPYEQFTSDGRWEAGVRDNGAGDYTVYVNEVDLFSVVFDSSNNATVTDLWMEDGDSGIDQLNDIEDIVFDGPVGLAAFNVDPQFGVSVYSDDYQPEVIDNGDGTFTVVGTYREDNIALSNYPELGLTESNGVAIESWDGNDYLEGHAGSNLMIGGEGDDWLDGMEGIDTAQYQSDDWNSNDPATGESFAPTITYSVNGSEVIIGTEGMGDLYRVNLDSQIVVDSVGDHIYNASTALTAGNAVRSAVEDSEDNDVFAVELEAGVTYQISLRGDESSAQMLSDTVFRGISDEAGNYIEGTYNDDSGTLNSYVEFTPEATGTFYLEVGGFGGNTGDYLLEVLPMGATAPTDTVDVPSEYLDAVSVEDIGNDSWWEGLDTVVNTENLHFDVVNGDGSGNDASFDLNQTDTGYDILVNGVKQDEIALA